MPIRPPALDDRSFQDLVDEVLARIPAHAPEYTNPRLGDPGRTLVELFAWLTDALLYRANLIPERQRLTFLRLLGTPMRPAIAARGIVSILLDDDVPEALSLAPLATVKGQGPVTFETRTEVTLLPVTAEGFFKRALTDDEQKKNQDVTAALPSVYGLAADKVKYYFTTPVFTGGGAAFPAFDLVRDTVDRTLWLALLASKKELVADARQALGSGADGERLLNIGFLPAVETPDPLEDITLQRRVPHTWEVSVARADGEPEYLPLDVRLDSTAGLTRRGILRLAMPAPDRLGAPSNDVRTLLNAGVGDRPPRIEDSRQAARLVAWVRMRPTTRIESLLVSWIGINGVEIDQRQTLRGRVVAASTGQADQVLQLPGTSIEAETLDLQVEETGIGYRSWTPIPDLALAGRDAAVYQLDPEAGTVRFGDGVRGRIPELGRRVRVALMRAGGGAAGNVPAGTLTQVRGTDLTGALVTSRKLKSLLAVATDGGADTEALADAEIRIPSTLRNRDRAVTSDDYKDLATRTPGVTMGRVEVLPRFKPQQRRPDVPGVISVMVLPAKLGLQPPAPRPDRPFLTTVHAYLDPRRPLGTELYVIGCEYVALSISIGVTLRDGAAEDQVTNAIRDAARRFLWPLPPGGADFTGWTLGRPVRDREIDVAIAQVPGVSEVRGVNLFQRVETAWQILPRAQPGAPVALTLAGWQLPELFGVLVAVDADATTDGSLFGGSGDGNDDLVGVPLVPELC